MKTSDTSIALGLISTGNTSTENINMKRDSGLPNHSLEAGEYFL